MNIHLIALLIILMHLQILVILLDQFSNER